MYFAWNLILSLIVMITVDCCVLRGRFVFVVVNVFYIISHIKLNGMRSFRSMVISFQV